MQGVQKHTTVQSWRKKSHKALVKHFSKKSRSYLKILGTKGGDMTLVPYSGTKNTRSRGTQVCRAGELAPGICTPDVKHIMLTHNKDMIKIRTWQDSKRLNRIWGL
jgi:hypothetical protein